MDFSFSEYAIQVQDLMRRFMDKEVLPRNTD